MQNKKGNVAVIAVIIIIVAITAAVLGYVFAKKSPASKQETEKTVVKKEVNDETADWQTYKNEKYGFEFKYPKELTYSELEIPKSVQDSAVKGEGYVGPNVFSLTIAKNAKDIEGLSSAISVEIKKRENNEKIVPEDAIEERRKIGEKEAIKHSGSYYVENKGYIYVVGSYGGDSYYDGIFEKILSTFKFTDSEKSGQVYRNEKYGFQITFPEAVSNYKVIINDETGNKNVTAYIYIDLPTTEKDFFDVDQKTKEKITGFVSVGAYTVWSKEGYVAEVKRCKTEPDPSCPYESEANLLKNEKYYFEFGKPNGILPDDVVKLLNDTSFYSTIENSFKSL